MPRKLFLQSYAKVNLHLEIGSKRGDGFHDLRSLFQLVDLGDCLELSLGNGRGIDIEGNFSFPTADNIMAKAAQVFFNAIGRDYRLHIKVEKRLPIGGGLGGGSSNAASVLTGLNAMLGGPLQQETLLDLALSLGSDVPFFLATACAYVEGRGEGLYPLPGREGISCLLVVPGFPIATRDAFDGLDRRRGGGYQHRWGMDKRMIEREYAKAPRDWGFFNDFWPWASVRYPVLLEYDTELRELDADFVTMTGSGSTMVALFKNEARAKRAADAMGGVSRLGFLLARKVDIILK